MIYDLPESITLGGIDYKINSDFRCILDIIEVLNDFDLTDRERGFLALGFFIPGIEDVPADCYQEATEKLMWFINCGEKDNKDKKPKLMDWEQDFKYIIAPVNKVVGHEVRSDKHFHWWSFVAAYMEIGECTFSQIVSIRQKKAEGRKLDKIEAAWYAKNRDIVDLKTTYTVGETDLLKEWGGG